MELRGTAITAARTTFLLVGIASTAFLLASSLPRIKTLAFAHLSPSYLFFAIHFIIIMIWKLNNHNYLHPPPQNEEPSYISDVTLPSVSAVETEIDGSSDMDATWKAISETDRVGRPRMTKSNTWEQCGRDREESMFRKSKTLRRISVGREELFGRAEAFIRINYEQRRIQRQESEQRYREMVNAAC